MQSLPNTLQALKTFGLSEPEASIYLTLLEIGPQTASVISKKANLKRGHTYNLLAVLIGKGVIQEFIKSNVKYFTCSSPIMLISLLERREEEIENKKRILLQAIPDLERIRNPMALQPKVRLFQGIDGIKEIYEDTLQERNSSLYAIGDFDHFFPREKKQELNDWMWEYCKRRSKKNIFYMGIANKSTTSDLAFKKRTQEKRKLKMLQDIDLRVELNIYGNKVAVISSSQDMVGLIIEDKQIADMLRNLHQAMWKLLPDYKL